MTGRPAVYFHVEFGVSWTPGQGKTRQATYASRSLREHPSQYPRLLPATNADHLAPPTSQQAVHPSHQEQRSLPYQTPIQYYALRPRQHSPRRRQHQQHRRHPETHYHHHQQQQQQQQAFSSLPPHAVPAPSRNQRRSRSLGSSSHERGRSAPPPVNTNPWDEEPEPMAATVLPPKRKPLASPSTELGKDLPATPTDHFRLGEIGMPWSTALFPAGFVEEIESDNGEGPSRRAADNHHPQRAPEDRDRSRFTEIESLAAALMTVDNGFEDQWWYQGPRLVHIAGELKSPAALEEMLAARERMGSVSAEELMAARERLGSLVSPLVDEAEPIAPFRRASLPSTSPVSSVADIVSPVSEYPSPASNYRPLRRSLTTRSDELHM